MVASVGDQLDHGEGCTAGDEEQRDQTTEAQVDAIGARPLPPDRQGERDDQDSTNDQRRVPRCQSDQRAADERDSTDRDRQE
jgi:hypothetical protein